MPSNAYDTIWTEEKIQQLRDCVAKKMSAGATADLFGAKFTRNSALMKARRLGLRFHSQEQGIKMTKRNGPPKGTPKVKKRAMRFGGVAVTRLFPCREPTGPVLQNTFVDGNKFDASIPQEQRRSLMKLAARECHWPVGDPKEPGFFFCGGTAEEDKCYCLPHLRRSGAGYGRH